MNNNICMLSFECPPGQFSGISRPNKEKYCKFHGYDFLFYSSKLSNRPPAWNKISYIKKVFDEFDYEWIFWQDADTYVINHHRKIEEFIDPDKDLICCEDDVGINTGSFLIKRSDFSSWLLDETWNFKKYGNNVTGTFSTFIPRFNKICKYDAWEQTNMHSVIGLHGEKYINNIKIYPEVGDHFNVIPERWTQDTFIVHERSGHRKKIQPFKEYIY